MPAKRKTVSTRRSTPDFRIPAAPGSIQKGSSLAVLLDREAADCLAHNISQVHAKFDSVSFRRTAMKDIAPLAIMQRGAHLARVLRMFLPSRYEDAVEILLRSLTPPLGPDDRPGLSVFFYLPYSAFVAIYGLDAEHNGGRDPFDVSMRAQYEITRRFTAEFSMRPFLIRWPERTLARLMEWTRDPDENVRRLCSEGSRPRLPWGLRIPSLIKDPRPALPILETLKDDSSLYVRRSVANHVGDIAKDNPRIAFDLCEGWARGATEERKWMIRHAVRHPAKKGVAAALRLRQLAAR
jgi:3-methyladenine DNA glycosylase AlkC